MSPRADLGYTSYQGRTQWYLQHWGPPAHVLKRTMPDEATLLGVMLFPPRRAADARAARPFWTYATNGLSEHRMPCRVEPHGDPSHRLELIAHSHSHAPWVEELLVELARYPFVHGSGLALGHTLPVRSGAERPWHGYLVTAPQKERSDFNPLAIDIGLEDWVFFAQIVGLLRAELDLAIAIGGPAFQAGFLRQPTSTGRDVSMLDEGHQQRL